MDPIDLEILKRLEKLKERPQVPSEDELRAKLNRLKDRPEASSSIANKYVLLPKPKSDVEQVDSLMKQFTEEVALRKDSAAINEIEKRLQKLKSDDEPRSKPMTSSQAYSPESDTKILLKKILAEASLEKKTELKFPHLVPQFSNKVSKKEEKMDYSDAEEEFCTICDRYPKWICVECNDHKFCTRCFKEYHDDMGEYHKKKPYTQLRRRSSSDSGEYSD